MVKRQDPRRGKILVYVLTLIFALGYIFIGRNIAMVGYPDWGEAEGDTVKAKVLQVISDTYDGQQQNLQYEAKIQSGEYKDQVVIVLHTVHENYYPKQLPAVKGDKILIFGINNDPANGWQMLDYVRLNGIIWLAVLFTVAVVLFGRMKGLNSLISMAFTCLAIFMVFVPAVLSGQNVYIWTITTSVYIILITMLFINGTAKKSIAAGLGCFGGVVVAGALTAIMDKVLRLTGMATEDTLYLQMLPIDHQINLNALVFAAIVIGALGAIMDVAMDISSALNEIRINSPDISGKRLIQSGFAIGRDTMGTMVNTLVLAYIGSSLLVTLLLVAYNVTSTALFNMEMIIIEFLQALVGSVGILLAIPLTSFICAALYSKQTKID